MNPQDETCLRDMLDAARQAMSFVTGRTRADLEINQMLVGFAVVRALEIIGVAAGNVSRPTRDKYPEVPWKAIIGTRNRVAHAYNRVDYDIVWDIATLQLPPLIVQLEAILPPETGASLPE